MVILKHKQGNPVRLITSCCGTGIEKLSAFTEFYLKPLGQNLLSFIKDTTEFINRIDELNMKGPLPFRTLLVSWDVVALFLTIDNNLGLTAVRKALESKIQKFPSTAFILEAVEICLKYNNCQFLGKNFVQIHGTAMESKNACSYADTAMEEIAKLANYDGPIKPMLWWRYRDDILDIWTQGVEKLLEFTEYINSLYPTIKFELVYSANSLNVLDLTLRLNNYMHIYVYFKSTDNHLYLYYFESPPTALEKSRPIRGYFKIKKELLRKYLGGKV